MVCGDSTWVAQSIIPGHFVNCLSFVCVESVYPSSWYIYIIGYTCCVVYRYVAYVPVNGSGCWMYWVRKFSATGNGRAMMVSGTIEGGRPLPLLTTS